MRHIRSAPNLYRGVWVARSGSVLGVVSLVGLVIDASLTSAGVLEQPENDAVWELATGDCLTIDRLPDLVREVPCAESHEAEIVLVRTLDRNRDRSYPVVERVEVEAAEQCREAWPRYVGSAWDDSALDVPLVLPGSQRWPGDSRAFCLALAPSGPLTGSIRGSGR